MFRKKVSDMNMIYDTSAAAGTLKKGLFVLSVCCGSYILFWLNGYQPEKAFRRSQPLSILLFILTFALGAIGLYFTINGMNQFKPKQTPVSGTFIIIAAVIVYIVTAWITLRFFNRPITTELLLITLWTALIVQILNVSTAQNLLSHTEMIISIILLILVFVLCIVLYVVYYQMDPWPAYWAAAMPLLAIGVYCSFLAFLL